MSNRSVIRQYILDHKDTWVDDLTKTPYNLTIRKEDGQKLTSEEPYSGLLIFKYSQIDSDFSNPIVQEARGIILNADMNFEVECKPFNKFFNIQEKEASHIDWSTAQTMEKVDGSIVKLFYNDNDKRWQWASNGVIDANRVDLMLPSNGIKTFQNMIDAATGMTDYSILENINLNHEYTYVFELVGPQNRVVIPYDTIQLYYLATISRLSFFEYYDPTEFLQTFQNVKEPKIFPISNEKECMDFVQSPDFNSFLNEGFVVKDDNNNRVKVKTEDYLRVHRLRGEMIPNNKKILDIILQGEDSEFLSYFPEYKTSFEEVNRMLQRYQTLLENDLEEFKKLNSDLSRKEIAKFASSRTNPSFLFSYYDGKVKTAKDFIREMKIDNLLSFINKLQ
jgi:hypothetical protein